MSSSNKLSICIVSPNAYGLVSGDKSGFVGGVEWQTTLLAKWLVQHDFSVSLVTWAIGNSDDEYFDGVRVIKICSRTSGVPWLRFFCPKWTGLVKALKKADADLYYHNCSEAETGQMVLWCKHNKKPTIFSTASNADVLKPIKKFTDIRERLLYRYGLMHAYRIIVQTRYQGAMLWNNYHLASKLIPMPAVNPSDSGACSTTTVASNRILWLGRVCRDKRLDRLVPVATQLPQFHFDVVGPIYPSEENQQILAALKPLQNVTLHGLVTKELVPEYIKKTHLLLSTSETEGFPNTFLEAWSYGVPVVTTFDPDGLVAEKGLGCAVADPVELVPAIEQLMNNQEMYCAMSQTAKQYFQDNHTVDAVMPLFADFFEQTIRSFCYGST